MTGKLCLMFIFIGKVFSQIGVEVDVTTPIRLNQDNLVITCLIQGSPSNVFSYVIHKRINDSFGFMEVVRTEFVFIDADGGLLNTTWSDTDVEARAFLSGISLPSSRATLILTILKENVSCERDTADYMCEANASPAPSNPRSDSKEVIVIVPAEAPHSIDATSEEFREGAIYTFTCTSVLYQTDSRLRWWLYRTDTPTPLELTENITLSDNDRSICYRNSTSTLKYTLDKEDNDAVIRCSVYHMFLSPPGVRPEDYPHIETGELDVFYRVGTPMVTKQPDMRTYESGNSLALTCSADGNPSANSFEWYIRPLNGGMENTVSSLNGIRTAGGSLSITNTAVAHSGIFICEARNSFNNMTFMERTEVEIIIVERASSIVGSLVGMFFGGLAAGVLLAVGIALLNKKVGMFSKLTSTCNKRSGSKVGNITRIENSNTVNDSGDPVKFGDVTVENGAPPIRSTYVESG